MAKEKTEKKEGKVKKKEDAKTEKAKEGKVKKAKEEPKKEDKKEKIKEEKTKKEEPEEEDFWDTEAEPEEHIDRDSDAEEEIIDPEKLEYTKIKDLSNGTSDVNVVAEIDFVGELQGRGFGEEPRAIGFLKDKTGEVKMTFWGDAAREAKKGRKVRIIKGFVTEYYGQLQLNAHRKLGVEFLK